MIAIHPLAVVLLVIPIQIRAQILPAIRHGNHQKLAMMMKNGLYIQTYKKNKGYSEFKYTYDLSLVYSLSIFQISFINVIIYYY